MFWFLVLMASPPVAADTVTLFSGASLEAELVVYQYQGNCQLSITGGDLAGTILVTPCSDIKAFERLSPPVFETVSPVDPDPDAQSEETPIQEEQSSEAEITEEEIPEEEFKVEPGFPLPLLSADDAPSADDDVEDSPHPPPVAIATLPPGFTPPGALVAKPQAEPER